VTDLRAAASFLRRATGVERFAVVTACVGALTALDAVRDGFELDAAVLFPFPVNWARAPGVGGRGPAAKIARRVRRALRLPGGGPARSVNPRIVGGLSALATRGGRARLFVDEDDNRVALLGSCLERLAREVPETAGRLELERAEAGLLGEFVSLADQEFRRRRAVESVVELTAAATAPS
jgi:hypothetical protein